MQTAEDADDGATLALDEGHGGGEQDDERLDELRHLRDELLEAVDRSLDRTHVGPLSGVR